MSGKMKLVKCKFCNKTYPDEVMETMDYCSEWCLAQIKPYSIDKKTLDLFNNYNGNLNDQN